MYEYIRDLVLGLLGRPVGIAKLAADKDAARIAFVNEVSRIEHAAQDELAVAVKRAEQAQAHVALLLRHNVLPTGSANAASALHDGVDGALTATKAA